MGRTAADAKADLDHHAQQDARIRNAIEGKFGQGKRRFTLNRVMAKLPHTAATAMAITVLVMNLEQRLRTLVLFLVRFAPRSPAKGVGRFRWLRWLHWLPNRGDRAFA